MSDLGLIWRPFHKYLQIKNFFQISGSIAFYLYSPLTSCKKSGKSLRPFLRKLRYKPTNQSNIKVSDLGLIWRPFCEYLQIKNFFQISGSATFLPLKSPNLMLKIRKILRVIFEKTVLPNNQLLPTTLIFRGPCWHRSKKKSSSVTFLPL